ncbi:hypothetical protein CAPTEDRAFT_221358 [Capitella teleta]|uniref:Carbohydrate sulfotransferase n=1 Tax=Capitella teleta TaxID=283909 RepID=R7UNJ1_CAPTE|nr:hypothetical protein CAPTEDRAFT_221358 [Capitella teleta]|eukprot:ELU07795.1 hypothetical protein CAPTEDRAFT_221358 [Capitella teleta]
MAILKIRFSRVCVFLVLCLLVIHVVRLVILKPQRIPRDQSDDADFLLLSGHHAAGRDAVKSPFESEEPECSTGPRIHRLQEWCRPRKKPVKLTMVTWRNLYVDHEHELLFCEVPKAGASTLKKLLIQAAPLFLPNSSVPRNIHRSLEKFNITHPKQSIDALQPILRKYFKFVVVRHPITRLLSAYKDKFYDTTFLPKISRHIVKNYRQKHKNAERDSSLHPQRPTWVEFADFVGTEYSNVSERHWKTVMELCSPCLIGYDAILKLETLERDVPVVIKHISQHKMVISHENESRGVEGKDSQSYLRELSQSVIEKLQNVYRHDLDLFGYRFNESAIPDCYDDRCIC